MRVGSRGWLGSHFGLLTAQLGFRDAIVTSFSLVVAMSSLHFVGCGSVGVGFLNLVADGISMGFGDFLSSVIERVLAASEREVTEWDVRYNLLPQLTQLVATYQSLGMTHQDAAPLILLSITVQCGRQEEHLSPPVTTHLTDQFSHLSFKEGYSVVWGGPTKVQQLDGGNLVNLILDKSSGSGFISQDDFYYGFFSAAIKLPANYSAGIVVAFYTSNADVFPHTHDELDFEFLGHVRRKQWVLQTNVYGNGSVHMGREERFHLWFDPAAEFHEYTILWNYNHTVFFVDNIPIREILHTKEWGVQYPSKPMSVYSTIWDGSDWATEGGKYPVDYKFAPFVASYTNLELDGCVWNPTQSTPLCSYRPHSTNPIDGSEFKSLDAKQRAAMDWARKRFMTYSYCQDFSRYPTAPPECQGQRKSNTGPSQNHDYNMDSDAFEQEEPPTMTRSSKYGRMKFSMPPSQRMPGVGIGMDRRAFGVW